MNRPDRATIIARGRELITRARSLSLEIRSAQNKVPAFAAELLTGGPKNVEAAVAHIDEQSEELKVAAEEIHVQVEELERLSRRLEKERHRYRELFDSSPDAVLVTDRFGAVQEVNEAASRLLEREARFLRGKPLAVLVDVADVSSVRETLNLLEPGLSREVRVRLVRRTGGRIAVRLRALAPGRGARIIWTSRHEDELAGEPSRPVMERALRDKDDLLQRERTLRKNVETASRAKDRFLAILSHDLRSPVNAILGWTELLRRELLDQKTRDRALATIERNARAQAELIGSLLDLSRMAEGRLQLELKVCDLAVLVQAAVDASVPEAASRGISFETSIRSDTRVMADPARLGQAVSNLLSNALKFTSRGGHVVVRVSTGDDGTVRLIVADDGRGIPPELLPHIFDVYTQDEDKESRAAGLGLGLFIVRQIVDLHGGTVDAESGGTGRGSAFTVKLPLHDAAVAGESAHVLPAADLQGLKVLVLEDELDARELLAMALRDQGAEVVAASGAAEAFELLGAATPDLIVSDIGLPNESGLDFIRRVRAAGVEVPAIAVTGFASSDDARRALDAGFDAHLPKPITQAELLSTLERALDSRDD